MQYRYNQSEVELRHYKEAYERGYLKTNFLYKGNSEFIFSITPRAIVSPDIVSSNTQTRYFTCCLIFIPLSLKSSSSTNLKLRPEQSKIYFVLCPQKFILSLLSTNQWQMLLKSLINPFVTNAPFLYPLKTSENRNVRE